MLKILGNTLGYLLYGLILIFLPAWGVYSLGSDSIAIIFDDQPTPAKVEVYLPSDAVVQPSENVHPGTFSIESDIEEWKKIHAEGEHPDQPVVSFNNQFVQYWLPRKGSDIYHYAKVKVKVETPKSWGVAFQTKSLNRREDGTFVLEPNRNYEWLIPRILGIIGLGFVLCIFGCPIYDEVKDWWLYDRRYKETQGH